MESNRLFETALGIISPWHIEQIDFDPKRKQLDILYSNFGFSPGVQGFPASSDWECKETFHSDP